MITYVRWSCILREAWFDEEPECTGVDVIRYCQHPTPVAGASCREFFTLLIDLSKPPDALLAALDRDTRYKIRRAEKDGFVVQRCDPSDRTLLAEFCDFYDRFAAGKGRAKISRWKLQVYARAGALELSRCVAADGTPLVWHALLRSGSRVRGLYSPSLYRQSADSAYRSMIGRANCSLHWLDMLRFRSEGISILDFGGWYTGHTDHEKLRINEFKKGFGGEIVKEYDCVRGVTAKGKILGRLHALLPRARPQ